jgi:hypothetical protein
MCQVYPKISQFDGGLIRITFPSNRPYKAEIVKFMDVSGYKFVGARHCERTMEDDFDFKSNLQLESRLNELLKKR